MLIVEDGTGTNPDANTYLAMVDIQAYAADRGVTLDSDEGRVFRAMDWLEYQNWRWSKYSDDQPLQWPRVSTGIPNAVKAALCQLVIADFSGVSLYTNRQSEKEVKSEQVGELKVEYTGAYSSLVLQATKIIRDLVFSGVRTERA